MSSISQLSTNSRSMNGLNTINANAVFTDTLEVNTLTIDSAGTAPTVSALSNDNNIATTAWVTNHAGGAYVTLNTTQTVTGQKTFSNANTFITGNTVTNSIRSSSSTSAINIGQNIQSGAINLGTTFIGPTMNVPLSWGLSSNQGILSLQGGSFNLYSSGNYTQRCGPTLTMSIADSQTTGVLNIGTATARSGVLNIGTGATATNDIRIGTGRSTAGKVSIGSNLSNTNTVEIFSKTINIGTSSPSLATNTVNIGNGILGSNVNVLNNMTVTGDFFVGDIFNYIGTNLTLNAPAVTDSIVLTAGNTIDLNGFTNINGTTNVTGGIIASGTIQGGEIMTNTYKPLTPVDDVYFNPLQTSGSIFMGNKVDRSGIIEIACGLNATSDIRIGTRRTTSGVVSVGSNSSLSNTLNLQSNTVNIGTGSPVGASNTVNIGNGNAGSIINLKNETNINTTGAGFTYIGQNTATAGDVDIKGRNINFTAYSSIQLEATNGFWTNVGQGNFYYRAYNGAPQWLLGDQTAGLDYLTIQATATGSTIDALSQPLTINASQVNIANANITDASVEITSPLQIDPTFVSYPVTGTHSVGRFLSTTTLTKGTTANINLASLSIPVAGCWLVEGCFMWSGTGTAQQYSAIGLSTTSAVFDNKRQSVVYQGGASGGYGNQVTSVFNFTSAGTVYFVQQVPTNVGASTVQNNYMSATRLT